MRQRAIIALTQPAASLRLGVHRPAAGHLSHGYQTDKKKISAVSIFFETFPYRVNEKTGIIDYDAIAASAELFRPKLFVAGARPRGRRRSLHATTPRQAATHPARHPT